MKTRIYIPFLSLMLGILFAINAQSIFAESINWRSYSNQVFVRAKQENKSVLVYVKSNTCHWCARMNAEVFSDAAVAKTISENFIPVIVDIQSDSSIADQYGVRGTPTIIILDGNHNEISRIEGYEPVSEFEAFLKGAKS